MNEEIRRFLKDLTLENLQKVISEVREDVASVEITTWNEVELMENYSRPASSLSNIRDYPMREYPLADGDYDEHGMAIAMGCER